ncbi:hypothetical protein ACRAWG_15235 [Methylobacterium sp. P31]
MLHPLGDQALALAMRAPCILLDRGHLNHAASGVITTVLGWARNCMAVSSRSVLARRAAVGRARAGIEDEAGDRLSREPTLQ